MGVETTGCAFGHTGSRKPSAEGSVTAVTDVSVCLVLSADPCHPPALTDCINGFVQLTESVELLRYSTSDHSL